MEKTVPTERGVFTRKEIFQQPEMWKKTYDIVHSQKHLIAEFFNDLSNEEDYDMVLTGAGSSAFVGNAVSGVSMKNQKQPSRTVATTELITHPDYYLLKEKPTVLVSFARSGNSPESMAAVKIVNNYCDKPYHIIITCNESGALFRKTGSERTLKILLPPETNDLSLAMTSSFTSMMLAFILVAKIETLAEEREKVVMAGRWGETIISEYETLIADMAILDFKRAVFLGSGPLRGTAEESHLKLQELSDGAVICTFNSFLGFRHGPKAVVNSETLLVYLFSDDENCRKYEYDLVSQIDEGNKGMARIALCHRPLTTGNVKIDLAICFGKTGEPESDIEYLCMVEVILAQLLGFYKSLSLGLDPDNPSVSGTISRVVEGVKIYKLEF